MDFKRDKLERIGCTNVKSYTLVNNFGYTFSKGGVDYDLRYWDNCYGVYGGGWRVDPAKGGPGGSPSFGGNFNAVLDWIENHL